MFSGKAAPSDFLKKIKKIKVLLYHSLHQTNIYTDWLNACVTNKQKTDLDNLSRVLIQALTTQIIKVKPSGSEIDYYYRRPKFILEVSLPSPEVCHVNLAAICQAMPGVVQSIDDFDKILALNKVAEFTLMAHPAITRLVRSNELIEDTSVHWQHKINQINSILYDLNATLRDLNRLFDNLNRNDIIVHIHDSANKLEMFISQKIDAYLMLDNLSMMNHWAGLINKIALGHESDYVIDRNVRSLLRASNIFTAITDYFDQLMSHNQNFEFYLKCMLSNHCDQNKLANFTIGISSTLNQLMIEARSFRGNSIFQLGREIEKGGSCLQNISLACDYYELAFIHSEHHKERSLAFYKIKRAYYQSLINPGSIDEFDPVHASLQQLQLYLRQSWNNMDPKINIKRIVLDLITCKVAKIKIDYRYKNVWDDTPNSNLISLLYLIDQHNFTNSPRYHLKLKKILLPINDLYLAEKLSTYDKEVYEKICMPSQMDVTAAQQRFTV